MIIYTDTYVDYVHASGADITKRFFYDQTACHSEGVRLFDQVTFPGQYHCNHVHIVGLCSDQ